MKYFYLFFLLMLVGMRAQASEVVCESEKAKRSLPYRQDLIYMMEAGVEVIGLKQPVEEWYENFCNATAGESTPLKVLVKKRRRYEIRQVYLECTKTANEYTNCEWSNYHTIETYSL